MAERRKLDGGWPLRALGDHPLPRPAREEDHGTVDRRWVCLATLGPIGVAALTYVVVVRGFVEGDADHGLAWPLLGALPLFVFGMWLLTVSSSRTALFVALAATAMLVGSAYETFVQRNIEIMAEPWFPLFNVIGLTADATATSTLLIVFATFPTGEVEHRWQRFAVAFLWVPMLVGPLTLLTTPHVVMSPYIGFSGDGIPNPFVVPWLEWAAPIVYYFVYMAWPAVVLGLAVLGSRALFGEARVRARTRVMAHHRCRVHGGVQPVDLPSRGRARGVRRLRVPPRAADRRDPRDLPLWRVRYRPGRPRTLGRALIEPAHHGALRHRRRDPGGAALRAASGRAGGAHHDARSPSPCCRCAPGCSGGCTGRSSATATAS